MKLIFKVGLGFLCFAIVVWTLLLCLVCSITRGAETNYLGCLTSTNQITLSGNPPFVVGFESMEVKTNTFKWLNHTSNFITCEDVPAYLPTGLIKLTVSQVEGSETNLYAFRLLAAAPVARLSKRYAPMSPPMPENASAGRLGTNPVVYYKGVWWSKGLMLPGGTNGEYPKHRSQ